MVKIRVRNTDVRELQLPAGRPIMGVVVHVLNEEYQEKVLISTKTLRTFFLSEKTMAEAIRTNKITEASAASLKTPFTDDQNHEPITPKQYVEAAE